MMGFEKLDAWKVCHDLVLATYDATENMLERDRDLALRLRFVAVRAAARLARGAGIGTPKALMTNAGFTLSYLSEYAFLLGTVQALGFMPEKTWTGLDALRGRAAFYTGKIISEGPPSLDDL